jgi:hypothetical protein
VKATEGGVATFVDGTTEHTFIHPTPSHLKNSIFFVFFRITFEELCTGEKNIGS